MQLRSAIVYCSKSCTTYIIAGEVVVATVESEVLGQSTIRHADCDFLLAPTNNCERCLACATHRNSLRAMVSKQHHTKEDNDRAAPDSSVNFRFVYIHATYKFKYDNLY